MNPLVEKMLIAQREGIDVRALEQIFEHEVKCESPHTMSECSVEVTHVSDACRGGAWKICDSAAEMNRMYMESGLRCKFCGLDLDKCWTIRPI